MKAICTHNDGNNFDPKVGEVVDVKTLYITRIWRKGSEISIQDENEPRFNKSQDAIYPILREGDYIENNYCHGEYRIL